MARTSNARAVAPVANRFAHLAEGPRIVGLDGAPLPAKKPSVAFCPPDQSGNIPYDAADIYGGKMEAWRPFLWSPDGELNMFRDRIVSRVRDLVRNDGWAAGAVTRILDNAVGANLRPISKPDYRALQAYTGNKAFDHVWANEFGRAVDVYWRAWANDTGKWCDATRTLTMSQMFRVAFRHKLIDGDCLAQVIYDDSRVAPGKARYATMVMLIDPDRLSNPQQQFDQNVMRGGVEIDRFGAATAYHIRQAHIGDWFSAGKSVTWDRIPRETSWGRPIIVHDFEHDRAGQHRGGAGIFTPVLQRLKMLVKYDNVELDAAIVNSIFGAYVTSPFDPQLVEEAMGDKLPDYQKARADFHSQEGNKTMLGDVKMPILFPGEEPKFVKQERPNSNFPDFEGAMLRNVAAATGISAQQLSQNWSDVNYSSARAALLEAWKTITRRREEFAIGFCNPIRNAAVEEIMELEDLPMPSGAAPMFMDCRDAYARCTWMGPGRGWVDPVAEKEGAVLGMEAGLSTLEDESAISEGKDWEETVEQRAVEVARFKELGLEPPTWSGMQQQKKGGTDSGSHDPDSPNYRSR